MYFQHRYKYENHGETAENVQKGYLYTQTFEKFNCKIH